MTERSSLSVSSSPLILTHSLSINISLSDSRKISHWLSTLIPKFGRVIPANRLFRSSG